MATNPSLEVNVNSIMSSTVASPLAHILTDYKNLHNAQLCRSYADAWNTTAHIITEHVSSDDAWAGRSHAVLDGLCT